LHVISRCSLGDVTNTDAYYDKALEVSNNKSTRAKVKVKHAECLSLNL